MVHIPMSSGLSNSCETAMVLAREYHGRVHVVDNQRISVTQRQSVLDAIALVKAGKTGAEIKEVLEKEKQESSIYIILEDFEIFKEGRQNHRQQQLWNCAESETSASDSGR